MKWHRYLIISTNLDYGSIRLRGLDELDTLEKLDPLKYRESWPSHGHGVEWRTGGGPDTGWTVLDLASGDPSSPMTVAELRAIGVLCEKDEAEVHHAKLRETKDHLADTRRNLDRKTTEAHQLENRIMELEEEVAEFEGMDG